MDKTDKSHIAEFRDSERDTEREEGKSGKSRKKLDLSLAQVLGSAVAAVVAAFAAGQLGVYGTFLGAGVVSLVATSGGAIFQHFFSKTGEQIKEVTLPPKARRLPVGDPAAGWKSDDGHHTAQAAHNAEALDGAPGTRGVHDSQATRLFPAATPEGTAAGADDATRALRVDDVTRALRTDGKDTDDATRMLRPQRAATGAPGDDATRVLGTVKRPAGPAGPEAVPGDGEFTEATTHGTRWRGWRRTLLPAAVVFVIAIGGITAYEAISGHTVSGGKGTSISDVFRSGSGSSGDSTPEQQPIDPEPGQSEQHDGTTPSPGDSQPSTGPGDQGGEHRDQPGSGDSGGRSTPTPDPSGTQPGGAGGSQDGDGSGTGKTPGQGGDQDSGQDGSDSGTDSDKGAGGAGSGSQLPQKQPVIPQG
ncbi:hypothetical protein ABZ569_24195 [Streptomyces albus]|uniref:hypothetical protein n=1 Tax=Streptomyces albus TaxID=1888 RepID=UPI0033D87612